MNNYVSVPMNAKVNKIIETAKLFQRIDTIFL